MQIWLGEHVCFTQKVSNNITVFCLPFWNWDKKQKGLVLEVGVRKGRSPGCKAGKTKGRSP